MQSILEDLYPGGVDTLDPYVGGLFERTLSAILSITTKLLVLTSSFSLSLSSQLTLPARMWASSFTQ
jgi:hypothetical protein